jgi:hypothetical protein
MKYLFLLLFIATSVVCNAQNILVPSDNIFEKNRLKNSKTEMAYFAVNGNKMVEIGSFVIDIASNNKTMSVYTTLQFLNSTDLWIDTCISDAGTFKPMYRSSFSKDNAYVLKYNKEVTGYYFNKQTQKRTAIQEPVKDAFFDSYAYPYFLSLLPLTTGYKKDLIVYDYKPENKTNIKKTRIEEVKNNTYVSTLTGNHKVWQVSVFEEATNDKYEYYIDKDTRKIWKIEILAKGQKLLLLNKELDYNPFVNKFDKEETLKLIKNGSAVISGQVFARDNQNDGKLKGIAIFNINKKQFAKTGTSIILIPYTNFFKEWLKLNEASRKKGKSIPLPVEATECIKVTPVYDDEGHFEFVNLMPGDYLVYTEFGYVHSGIKTEVTGYTDTYINGIFQGSMANRESSGYSTNASASVKKVVTIKTEGEKVSVKLKKTL